MTALAGALGIFALRVIDVSLGTMRILMLQRGLTWRAGAVAFFESLTWVLAAAQVIGSLDNPLRIAFYAGGFAAGTVAGATVERWLAMGSLVVRVITPVGSPAVASALRAAGFGVTVFNAEGFEGDVRLAFVVAPRRRQQELLAIVREVNPEAFVTIEDVSMPELKQRRRALVRA